MKKGYGVLQVAQQLKDKENLREAKKPVPTWPPLEPLAVLQVRPFPVALIDRLKVLAVLKHKKMAEVTAQVIREGLKVVESSGDNLPYKPSDEVESG